MLFSAKEFIGSKPEGRDGSIGSVNDLYFDHRTWEVRYIVVDTGNWLPGRKVLIIPKAIGSYRPGLSVVQVNLSTEEIRNSPPIELAEPVSRVAEALLHSHFGWMPYWADPLAPPPPPTFVASHDDRVQAEHDASRNILRSFNEVKGYHIHSTDGDIGHVSDFVIGEDWKIDGLAVDTSNWLGGASVVIPSSSVTGISWADAQVLVGLSQQQIKDATLYEKAGVE